MALILLAATVASAGLAGAWLVVRLLGAPPGSTAEADLSAGLRVQQHLAQLLLREAGLSRESRPLVLTGPEINAFLTRHFDGRRTGFSTMAVDFEPGRVAVAGRTTLGRLLRESAFAWLVGFLPGVALETEVWLVARGRLEAGGGQGRFLVDSATVGRQPVSPAIVDRVVSRDTLRWRLPRVVERIEVEPGRLVIHTRSRGSGALQPPLGR